MPCEKYRETLSEIAAGGERGMSREVQAHLEACRECGAAFQAERGLFTEIDSGVQKTSNADVPVSFLPRVRESLDREASPQGSFLAYFVFAGVAMCAVLVVVGMHGWRRTTVEPRPISAASREAPVEKPSQPGVAHDLSSHVRPTLRRSSNRPVTTRAAQAQFTVLLPVGQKQAVDKLLRELRNGVIKSNDVIVEKAEAPSPDLQVSPLSISPIEVKPLATIVEDAGRASEKTKP
jgi:anti-sigma factor RsiW